MGQVRIIGGRWRGSKLPVLDRPGLRPSGDRVRETVFNWLQGELHGRRCLDLFAGSGALGFEAASRGAAEVVLVERDVALAEGLRATAARLHADNVTVRTGDALRELERDEPSWDIVFLDPPFSAALWPMLLPQVDRRLATSGWVYVEAPADAVPALPERWRAHRQGRTQQVIYTLCRVE